MINVEEITINKSKTYLLPYMNDFIPIKFMSKLINTYIFFKEEYKFCLLYEFSGKKNFLSYETILMQNEYYIETLDIDHDKVLYVFDIPEELFPIVDLFLDGKYSYLPNKSKIKQFLVYHFKLRNNNKIFHILDRTELLRKDLEGKLNVKIPEELDLSDPPNKMTEEFKLKEINEEEY